MRTKVFGIVISACLWPALILTHDQHDLEKWEKSIKESALAIFSKLSRENKLNYEEINGLIPLADNVIGQRENEIFERNCRIYASIALKLIPMSGIGPIIGYILDQRTLGIVIAIQASAAILGVSGFATFILAANNHGTYAAAAALTGLTATALVVYKCIQLEQWFWEKERRSSEKLETARQDAVTIRERLKILAAKKEAIKSKDE